MSILPVAIYDFEQFHPTNCYVLFQHKMSHASKPAKAKMMKTTSLLSKAKGR